MKDEKDKVPLAVKSAPKEGALLKNSWPLVDHGNCKIHFARWNGEIHPLDDWIGDRSRWQVWQEYYPGKNDFNRDYIFSLMQFYHEPKTWLFGGLFKVLERPPQYRNQYKVELDDFGKDYIGRLKIYSPYGARQTRTLMKQYYSEFVVKEILSKSYADDSFRPFPGFDKVNLSFKELEKFITDDNPNWRTALGSVSGVYLITDMQTGKRYVGSAYGEDGIWGRWSDYIESGHGGNKGIIELIESCGGKEYCRENFRFSLLEYCSPAVSENTIKYREGHWMEMLHTLHKCWGLNKRSAKKPTGGYMKDGYSPSQREG